MAWMIFRSKRYTSKIRESILPLETPNCLVLNDRQHTGVLYYRGEEILRLRQMAHGKLGFSGISCLLLRKRVISGVGFC